MSGLLRAAAIAGLSALCLCGAQAQANLTDVEKIYADLAKLPPKERQAKLEEGARKEGKLVIINTLRGQNVDQARMFSARYPYIALDSLNDIGSQDAAERLYAEEVAGRHFTDLVAGALSDFQILLRRNMLARYPSPAMDAILPKYARMRDPDNRWLPWFWSEHGISYNSNLVPPDKAPKAWMDLCDPFFKGSVSFEPTETRFIAGLTAILGEEKFREFAKCMGANQPIIQRGHDQRVTLMLAGDHMAQGDNYLYAGLVLKRKNNAPYEMVLTAPIMALSGISAINKNAARPYAAALFADWLLSDENQKYFADQLRGPVTIQHPYLPDDAPIVAFVDPPPEETAKLVTIWREFVETKK
jgi:iron(III) transport system substrate-binding protein